MGRHIDITLYFADEGYQQVLKDREPFDELFESEINAQSQREMEKRRSDAMEDIDLYLRVWNDCEVYTTDDKHYSQVTITLPKKADLDTGLFALVYHLFARGQITGFTIMHTGA